MKLNENYILKNVAGSIVVMPVGEAVSKINGMIKLNPTAEIIWKAIENGKDFDGIVSEIKTNCQNVDENAVADDVKAFLSKLEELGILEK